MTTINICNRNKVIQNYFGNIYKHISELFVYVYNNMYQHISKKCHNVILSY